MDLVTECDQGPDHHGPATLMYLATTVRPVEAVQPSAAVRLAATIRPTTVLTASVWTASGP